MGDSEVKYTDEGRVKLYVGSLPFDTRGPDLQEMFSKYGNCSNGKNALYLAHSITVNSVSFFDINTVLIKQSAMNNQVKTKSR